MNNLPNGCTQDMVDAQCSPIAKGVEECADCLESFPAVEMYPWNRYDWNHREYRNFYLCESCVPRCQHIRDYSGHVCIDLKPCGRIQSPTAQGPWCADHERESEALEESEEADA